ncbi:DJ-1/PfpI family protein [Corallococcus sp. CA053C]|uniref:DJ-1/PfpI family protein n=1 Tax=Corallococcus sp. CA053C TaxID=2316732 RepID=UPI000EA10658|nr:DJ-1/PfpI family protein [Corallococcus sp. CA053C]RKH13390.1 DJ-1/PfpI family protein [Corallococcus sp. CA053C]
MSRPSRRAAPLLLCLGLLSGAASAATPAGSQAPHYACPPCGSACDAKVFDKPGVCPHCGMKLVAQDDVKKAAQMRKKVAILIFNGVQIIDYTGPYEVFGAADFDVYTVAETKEPVTTVMGMTVVPKHSFADAPQADVVVVPGGRVGDAQRSGATLKWVTDQSARARQTLSVCNGAFILASAGLLEGLTATTTAGNLQSMQAAFPGIKVVDDQRFVDNGKVVTAAGLSAGIDGALHVVAKLGGLGLAQQVALGEEYEWRPRTPFVRAALADRLIPTVDVAALGAWDVTRTEGGTDRWELELEGTTRLSAQQVMEHVSKELEAGGRWTRVKPTDAGTASPLSNHWTFSGRDGRPWTGVLTLQPVRGTTGRYTAKLAIARAG